MLKSLRLTLLSGSCLAVLALGCGDDFTANSGYADPCTTTMAGVLGCPAASPAPKVPTVYDACQKLVDCGTLAGEFLHRQSSECTDNDSCTDRPGGECLPYRETEQCYYPYLDYQWCLHRLSALADLTDPCDMDQHPSVDAVQRAVDCIAVTECSAMGLSFMEKGKTRDAEENPRPEKDTYTCSDGETKVWTATICDFGLLYYERRAPQN